MNLPPTYYDVILERELDRPMIEAARSDIAQIKDGGPFGSVDDFSVHFNEYIKYVYERTSFDIQQQLKTSGIYSPLEINRILSQFFDSSDFKRLIYSKHADYLTLVNFELFGRKTFYLNQNLIDKLAMTDLRIESEFLKLPFDSCLFVLTGKTALRAFYSVEKHSDEEIDFKTPISVFASSRPASEGNRKIIFACWHANYRENYLFIKRELLIRDGWMLSETLQTNWDDIYRELGKENELTVNEIIYGKPINDEVIVLDGMLFFRILLNTILYLGSNDPNIIDHLSPHPKLLARIEAVKSRAKRKELKSELKCSSQLDFSEVGGDTTPIIVQKPNPSTITTQQNFTQLAKHFIVRGHWRNQAYGSEYRERKLIWIKPYYKGPEMAELINRPYVVK